MTKLEQMIFDVHAEKLYKSLKKIEELESAIQDFLNRTVTHPEYPPNSGATIQYFDEIFLKLLRKADD